MNRQRPRWRTAVGIVAGVAAFATTAGLAFTRQGADNAALPLAPRSTLGDLAPAHEQGRLGPEGVPIPTGRPLAPPRPLRVDQELDGITCDAGEQIAYHIHAHLRILVDGQSAQVPAGIGAARPYEVAITPAGQFVVGATCFMWLHTHAADGIVHVESPTKRTYTLGEFFDVWGQPLSRSRVSSARGTVTALFNGRVFTGNPRRIPLLPHSQIELEVGRPLLAPDEIEFPHGL